MENTTQNHEADEWVEEEVLVLAEISGIIDEQMLNLKDKKCKILGMETNEPILQIGDVFFAGDHDECVGTAVIFEEKASADEDAKKKLEYFDITSKKIKFKRVFLKEKDDIENAIYSNPSTEKLSQ